MIKRLFLGVISIICFSAQIVAQNLAAQFDSISINNDMMGGSLVVFCENGIIENLSIGKSDFTRNINTTADTKYRIASISKTITAMAIMQLVEQNLLDLDSDISSILGYTVQNPNHTTVPISTRMLLSHTSTIIDGSTYSSFIGATVNDNPIPNLNEILTPSGSYYTTGQFINAVPGSYFNYSNINYVILGTIVEKISNLRFDIYCKQYLSNPLGIDASFNVNDLTDIDQVAVLYRKFSSVWTPQADDYQGVQPVFNNLNGYTPGTNGGRFGPQGGFRCSGQDLAKIFLVLMNHGTYNNVTLLSATSCDAMFANEWTYNGNNGNNYSGLFRSWGLGIHRITSTPSNDIVLPGSITMLGHTGEAYGLVSDAYFDTIRKVGFVFINNGVGIGYQTNSNSAFYTVEQEIFDVIENHGNISDCIQIVGLNEDKNPLTMVYPNPALDFIYLSENLTQKDCKIIIRSIDGKILKNTFVNKGHSRIDIQELNSGMYFLELDNRIYKFIKE